MKYLHGKEMSKLSKSDLKSIVKECLIELLAEGLVSNQTTNRSRIKKNKLKESLILSKSSKVNKVHVKNQDKDIKHNVKLPKTNLTNNPMFNELLKDTANTTLQEQLSAEGRKNSPVSVSGDRAAKLADKSNPEDLFGDSASKWATLAFGKQN